MAKCLRCIQRGTPDNFGSEPKCAFEAGTFTPDNWACATALRLRELIGEDPIEAFDRCCRRYNDQTYAAVIVPGLPFELCGPPNAIFPLGGLIAMTWYKSRGATMIMRTVTHNSNHTTSLEEAQAAIERLEKLKH